MTKRVLIVDDDRGTTSVLTDMFGTFEHGCVYEITPALNADDAFVILREGSKFDLILLDLHMPMPYWRDGLGLLRHIRDLGMDVPVIMMCSMPTEADMDAAQSAGAIGWLLKPFKLSELEHLVALAADSLSRRSASPAARCPRTTARCTCSGPGSTLGPASGSTRVGTRHWTRSDGQCHDGIELFGRDCPLVGGLVGLGHGRLRDRHIAGGFRGERWLRSPCRSSGRHTHFAPRVRVLRIFPSGETKRRPLHLRWNTNWARGRMVAVFRRPVPDDESHLGSRVVVCVTANRTSSPARCCPGDYCRSTNPAYWCPFFRRIYRRERLAGGLALEALS